ncbi:MAG TPA: 16S rRNA (guanine(527)-N(7))-methyltransferase RsmG [Candidatus Eremiobacteraceae bacterium]|nr:16S rRNA (guanine(527)-N(7))-methyltransferase RsmG [Candidatus Eremiobacteraceae bacterium]
MKTASPEALLEQGLRRLNLPGDASARERLIRFGELVLDANRSTNLTGAKDLAELVTRHLLDSLAPLGKVRLEDPVVDLGSGAGFPGLPAAILFPTHRFILLEPRRKRAEFLRSAIERLGLSNVLVDQSSAGAAAQGALKNGAGTIMMRAVANPAESLRIALPMVRRGGILLLYEGRAARVTPEAAEVARGLQATIQIRPVEVPFLEAERHIWIVRKKHVSPVKRQHFRPRRRRST